MKSVILVLSQGLSHRILTLYNTFNKYNPLKYNFIIYEMDMPNLKKNEICPFLYFKNISYIKKDTPDDFKKWWYRQHKIYEKPVYLKYNNIDVSLINEISNFSLNDCYLKLYTLKNYICLDEMIYNSLLKRKTYENIIFIRSVYAKNVCNFKGLNINNIDKNKQYFLISECYEDSKHFKKYNNITRGISFKFNQELLEKKKSIDLIIYELFPQSIRNYYKKTYHDLYLLSNAKNIIDNCNLVSRFLFEGRIFFKMMMKNYETNN